MEKRKEIKRKNGGGMGATIETFNLTTFLDCYK